MSTHDSSDGSNGSDSCNTSNNNPKMTQVDLVDEGRLVLPPDTSARVAKPPKKSYPLPPLGKKLIFRWSKTDERTGRTIHAHNRPFPILVDDDGTV